jgi:hypothetical protein
MRNPLKFAHQCFLGGILLSWLFGVFLVALNSTGHALMLFVAGCLVGYIRTGISLDNSRSSTNSHGPL